ncbi:MAG: hypothetical protein JRG73_20075 [Deltaproteobacteria bacterium]|nr:hypothetical protein [Deltaproteobacteria bacterium]
MPKIDRKELLRDLQAVQPGLSEKQAIEQSNCYVFANGRITTFNDELACTIPCDADVQGAVQAKPLLTLLEKIPEDEITLEIVDNTLQVRGENRRAAIRSEQEIILPLEQFENERPNKEAWRPLGEGFCEAVGLCQQTASKNEGDFALTCVHIRPDAVEACNNTQLAYYELDTGFEQQCLIRREAIASIGDVSASEFAETESWVHFLVPQEDRNKSLCLSCRKYIEKYFDTADILKIEGKRISLPDKLGQAADIARIFSASKPDDDRIEIKIRDKKLIVRGEGVDGWYSETRKLRKGYDGPPLAFMVPPLLLKQLVEKSTRCWVAENHLIFQAGNLRLITCVSKVES